MEVENVSKWHCKDGESNQHIPEIGPQTFCVPLVYYVANYERNPGKEKERKCRKMVLGRKRKARS